MSRKLEQEVKFYLKDPAFLEKRLSDIGATLKQPRLFEINLRFDTQDRRLSGLFQALRLRQDQICRLTWKGAGDPSGEVSAREELEVTVSDLDTARTLLEKLGYEVMVRYEKYRSAWILGGVEVSLDELPFGNFCEVEGPDIASIRATAEKLGLEWEKRCTLSYLTLFANLKEKPGLDLSDLTFEAFRGIPIKPVDLGIAV